MMGLITDVEISEEECIRARDAVLDFLETWEKGGNHPASLIVEMNDFIAEVIEQCGAEVH